MKFLILKYINYMSQVLLNTINDINISNTKSGFLKVIYGGIGTTTLNNNQILIGNGVLAPFQTSNLTWNNISNTLSTTNIIGSGTGLTDLNASNISLGILTVTRGGIGTTSLNNNQILIGNGALAPFQTSNLTWNNTSNTLSATNIIGSGVGITELNASNISSGILTVTRGGIGTTTLNNNQILIGNGINIPLQTTNLTWNNTSNTLSATNIIGSGVGITELNASNISSGILTVTRGGIGTTTLNNNQILIGNGINIPLQTTNLTWNNTSNTLSATNIIGSGVGITELNASNISSGILTVTRGGIGTTTLNNNQILIGNGINIPLQTTNLTWNNTSNTLSATNIIGSGVGITELNASNISSGILTVTRGGIGTTTLNNNQILIGNGINIPLQTTNLTWNNTSNTLSATNIIGSGVGITELNASNISSGILTVTRGGIGTTTLNNNQILIGNGINIPLQTTNLTWNNTSNTLSATNIIGSGVGITELNASNISSGILTVTRGGIGTTTLNNNQILIGNGINIPLQTTNLTWNNTSNTLSATNIIGSGVGITELNASNISSGILTVTRGGIGTTTLNNNQILIGNGINIPLQTTNLTWNNTSNTLSATNIIGSGVGITELNASNISSGILTVTRGGIGTTTLNNNQILIGNGINIPLQTANLVWNNNNLGICKTNPSTTLDVSGNILTNSQFLASGNNISYSWLNDINTGIGRPITNTIGFYTNNLERLRIQSSGDVNINTNTLYVDSINHRIGIGLTNPSSLLHVNGNTRIDGSLIVKNLTVNGTTTIIDTNTQTTEQLIITNDGTGPAVIINQLGLQPILQLKGNNTTVLQVNNDGCIGIGITNPTSKIDILSNNYIGLKINQITDNNIIELQNNGNGIFYLNKDNMVVNNKFTLDSSGNLIIKGNIFGKNTISKVGFKFTLKTLIDPITLQNVYYYNCKLSKYYNTNQTLQNNNILIFRLTTFDISGNEIECNFIYISSYNGGIKKIIKNRIGNGDSQIYGWSCNDINTLYLTYYSDSIKTLYSILEPIL